jgi:hypothetical protein
VPQSPDFGTLSVKESSFSPHETCFDEHPNKQPDEEEYASWTQTSQKTSHSEQAIQKETAEGNPRELAVRPLRPPSWSAAHIEPSQNDRESRPSSPREVVSPSERDSKGHQNEEWIGKEHKNQDAHSGRDQDRERKRLLRAVSHAETSIPPYRQIPFDSGHRGLVAVKQLPPMDFNQTLL